MGYEMNDWVDHDTDAMPATLRKGDLVQVVLCDDSTEEVHNGMAESFAWGLRGGPGRIARWRLVAGAAASSKPTNPKDAIGVRKAPLSTVPMNVVAEVGVAMLEGAAKYGRHNYRGVGVRASVYFDATMRHLIDWWEGNDFDADSGMSHITKAIASLTVLRDAQMQNLCEDDRPPVSAEFLARLNAAAGAILDKHADKDPHHYTQNDAPPLRGLDVTS